MKTSFEKKKHRLELLSSFLCILTFERKRYMVGISVENWKSLSIIIYPNRRNDNLTPLRYRYKELGT